MARRTASLKLPTTRKLWAMITGSDRPGHLFAAVVAGLVVGLVGAALRWDWLVSVGVLVPCWEWACTPDVDLANRRNRGRGSWPWQLVCWAWLPYAKVVGHRSKWSHSLAYGLPARLGYVGAIVLGLVAVGVLPVSGLWALVQGAVTVVMAAIVGDTTHLWKDNYTIDEIIWGKA